jgi:hypothetical protein
MDKGDPEKAAEAKIRFEMWMDYKAHLRQIQDGVNQNLTAVLEGLDSNSAQYLMAFTVLQAQEECDFAQQIECEKGEMRNSRNDIAKVRSNSINSQK